MSRIRTIKPEFFKHEQLFDAEAETGLPLRLAFAGLWTCCDKAGRFEWRPRALRTDVLPYDDVDFSRALDALATRGFVVRYRVDGKDYGKIEKWRFWQSIDDRQTIPLGVRRAVFDRDGAECRYCGDSEGPFHLDHVMPWSRGGLDDVVNLVVSCAACNIKKGDRTPEEMGWVLQ